MMMRFRLILSSDELMAGGELSGKTGIMAFRSYEKFIEAGQSHPWFLEGSESLPTHKPPPHTGRKYHQIHYRMYCGGPSYTLCGVPVVIEIEKAGGARPYFPGKHPPAWLHRVSHSSRSGSGIGRA